MHKHTPGPWMLERETPFEEIGTDPRKLCSEVQARGFTVGYWVPFEWDGHSPDANLIAAAPEMLEALKGVMRHEHVRAYLPYDPHDSAFVAAMAAIRKAEPRAAAS
jgi:hypothetical protein